MRLRHLATLLALLAALAIPSATPAAAYFRTVSWNARHMGWSGETDWTGYANQVWVDYGTSSSAANGCDVIFLQEVMYTSSVTSFVSALNSVSGYTWAAATSGALGRSSYKEYYTCVYRTDRATLISNTTYADTGDKFEREPQIVRLRDNSTNADFTFINWHTIWGTSAERQAEINEIRTVFDSVQASTSSDQDVILLGDHNADATSSWWNNLKAASPAVSNRVNDQTTVNSSCAWASAYDHYWLQATYVTELSTYGRDYVANLCTLLGLSDHAPVWLRLYSSSDTD